MMNARKSEAANRMAAETHRADVRIAGGYDWHSIL